MRYKIYFLLLWNCFFYYKSNGQAPNWQVNTQNYVYSMSLIATGDDSCFSSLSPADIIGVFDEAGRCRGQANFINYSSGYRVVMTVYGNSLMELLTYKIYDAASEKVLLLTESSLAFEPEILLGSISAPEIITMCGEEVLEECISKLELSTPIMINTNYKVEDTIVSSSIISGNNTIVSFKAGKTIILEKGFWVKATSTFSATIEDCTPIENFQRETPIERRITALSSYNLKDDLATQEGLKVQLQPNPTSISMEVKYYLKQAEAVEFYISDNKGKLIRQIRRFKENLGWNISRIDTENLQTGCYFLTIRTQSEINTQKMIIIK